MQALTMLFDIILLNLLTLALCVPIVTAGASLTAMHFVLLHEVRSEGSSVIKMYFRSFKRNFKQATLIWLVILGIAAIIGLDFFAMKYFKVDSKVMKVISFAVIIVILCGLQYMFPLLSRYEIKTKKLLGDSMILAVGYIPRTLLMAALWVADGYLIYISSIKWLPVFLLIGLTFPGYLCALLYNPVLEKLDAGGKSKKAEDKDIQQKENDDELKKIQDQDNSQKERESSEDGTHKDSDSVTSDGHKAN